MNANNELKILGCEATDVVTGLKGVIVSVSFDVSGCIQGLLKPKVDAEGKVPDGYWFDTKRLLLSDVAPIVAPPTFDNIPGGESLPPKTYNPIK